jgi:hypothetical protein
MESFYYYIIFSWGITHLLVSGRIFESLRNWFLIKIPIFGELLNCYQCTSFWVGLIFCYFFKDLPNISHNIDLFYVDFNIDPLIYAGMVCGIIPFISLLFNRLIPER